MFDTIRTLLFRIRLKLSSPEKCLKLLGGEIGKDCCIYTKNFGSEPYLIKIGDHVQITSGVKFFTHGGGWILRNEIPDFDAFGKIIIGNNVYIGNNSLILPGVTIEDDVIIGAGSVITKSIPNGWVVAGNPARKIGNIEDYKKRMLKHNFKTKNIINKKNKILSSPPFLFIEKSYMRDNLSKL